MGAARRVSHSALLKDSQDTKRPTLRSKSKKSLKLVKPEKRASAVGLVAKSSSVALKSKNYKARNVASEVVDSFYNWANPARAFWIARATEIGVLLILLLWSLEVGATTTAAHVSQTQGQQSDLITSKKAGDQRSIASTRREIARYGVQTDFHFDLLKTHQRPFFQVFDRTRPILGYVGPLRAPESIAGGLNLPQSFREIPAYSPPSVEIMRFGPSN